MTEPADPAAWDNKTLNAPDDCPHVWEPAGMVFETQLLDDHGRVRVRQPDIDVGRCYFICRRCACHTYMATQWIGYRFHGSDDRDDAPDKPWRLTE